MWNMRIILWEISFPPSSSYLPQYGASHLFFCSSRTELSCHNSSVSAESSPRCPTGSGQHISRFSMCQQNAEGLLGDYFENFSKSISGLLVVCEDGAWLRQSIIDHLLFQSRKGRVFRNLTVLWKNSEEISECSFSLRPAGRALWIPFMIDSSC